MILVESFIDGNGSLQIKVRDFLTTFEQKFKWLTLNPILFRAAYYGGDLDRTDRLIAAFHQWCDAYCDGRCGLYAREGFMFFETDEDAAIYKLFEDTLFDDVP